MRVLVTGGNGFIGGYVVEDLVRRGHDVVVLDPLARDPRERLDLADPDAVCVRMGDIRDEVAVTEAMAHVGGWIHLGGVLGTQETIKNPRPAAHTNIIGGLNVLEAAAQYDLPGVNIAVGNHFENNTYSITKSTVERFCHMFRKERGLRVSVMRALNAYGPRQSVAAPYGDSKVRKIMPSFVMRALHGDPIEIYGDGGQIMDMVYVEDVARDLVDCLERTVSEPYDEVLESGTGQDITVNMVADSVLHATGSSSEVRHLPMRPGETPGVVVKALHPYGDSYLPLGEGVRRTVDYYRSLL